MELRPLLDGKVRINNIQLFGYHAILQHKDLVAVEVFYQLASQLCGMRGVFGYSELVWDMSLAQQVPQVHALHAVGTFA